MIRTLEAVIDPEGNVRLLEAVQLPGARRDLVTIFADVPRDAEAALLSVAVSRRLRRGRRSGDGAS